MTIRCNTLYECGICGEYHPANWDGDCREDEYRTNPEDWAEKMGLLEWQIEVIGMDEIERWRDEHFQFTQPVTDGLLQKTNGRDGSVRITGVQFTKGHTLALLDGVGVKGSVIRGGIALDFEAMDRLATRWLEHRRRLALREKTFLADQLVMSFPQGLHIFKSEGDGSYLVGREHADHVEAIRPACPNFPEALQLVTQQLRESE